MKTARSISFLVSCVLMAVGCAHTGINTPEGWNMVKTKNFTMYTPTTTLHDEALTSLEYHQASLGSSFFSRTPPSNIDVLFVEDEDFKDLFGHRRQFVALPTVPGGGKIGKDGLIVVTEVQDMASQEARDNAVAEALTHVLIHRTYPSAPLWFHEGFSAYARLAEYKEGDGQRMACFGFPGVSDTTFIPLEKLLKMSWEEYDGGEARSWYKHTARMLIDYTLHGNEGKNMQALDVIVGGIMEGKPSDEIMKMAYPNVSLAQLSSDVSAHGAMAMAHAGSATKKRGLCPIGFPVKDDRAPDVRNPRELKPADAEDIKALLAGLRKLPMRDDGYPGWFPPDVIAKAGGPQK